MILATHKFTDKNDFLPSSPKFPSDHFLTLLVQHPFHTKSIPKVRTKTTVQQRLHKIGFKPQKPLLLKNPCLQYANRKYLWGSLIPCIRERIQWEHLFVKHAFGWPGPDWGHRVTKNKTRWTVENVKSSGWCSVIQVLEIICQMSNVYNNILF